ncbi:hypothetical protein NBRC110019_10830 [Neptunitalea chrysea]|uniref:Uncharacterized protein n=1 Tax=Neptunitalea chrysea TaxID=1647581 RepID=A0A9W6B3W0_9FLAO|nr:hypothetical protein [Neptunitalea chrysea]GLB52044.1 hypothetical protein NBRC110019_10830 [Neptunitalea chrysea]
MPIQERIIITDEGISGDPWKGDYFNSFEQNILKIKKIYGNPKIVLGIRKHKDFILSIYKQHLHQKGYKDFSEIFNIENSGLIKHKDILFHPRIEVLNRNFENVFIYTQESLNDDLFFFTSQLADFLNVTYDKSKLLSVLGKKENTGVSSVFQVNLLKRLNRLNSSSFMPNLYSERLNKYKLTPRDLCQNKFKNIKSEKFSLTADMEAFIQDNYKKDWDESMDYVNTIKSI